MSAATNEALDVRMLAKKILKILQEQEQRTMDAEKLLAQIEEENGVGEIDAKEALWLLLGEDEVEFTSDWSVTIHESQQAAAG